MRPIAPRSTAARCRWPAVRACRPWPSLVGLLPPLRPARGRTLAHAVGRGPEQHAWAAACASHAGFRGVSARCGGRAGRGLRLLRAGAALTPMLWPENPCCACGGICELGAGQCAEIWRWALCVRQFGLFYGSCHQKHLFACCDFFLR